MKVSQNFLELIVKKVYYYEQIENSDYVVGFEKKYGVSSQKVENHVSYIQQSGKKQPFFPVTFQKRCDFLHK